jgi:hypothetical protein
MERSRDKEEAFVFPERYWIILALLLINNIIILINR